MKVIKIMSCDDCPHCEWWDEWNGQSNVFACNKLEKELFDISIIIDPDCPLEDR